MAKTSTTPQIRPMMTAPSGETRSQPAVMPTSPARMPFRVNESDGFPYFHQVMNIVATPPAAAARFVVRKTWEIAVRFTAPDAASCEPGLKPNQPIQRMNTPSAAIVRLWPRIDQQRDDRAVNQIHRELGPFRHCTAHNRSRGSAEDRLKDQKALHRQVTLVERQVAPVGHADETGAVAAEHEAEADEPEKQGTEHEVHEVLHQDVRRVFAAGETRLAQRKARLHEENQHGGQQHPDRIEGNGYIVHLTYVLKGSTFCPGVPCRRVLPCGWTRCR